MSPFVEFVSHPIRPIDYLKQMKTPEAGACVSFEGWVRNQNAGKPVQRLSYEAYQPLALKEIKKIVHEAKLKFSVLKIFVSHRLGDLNLGDVPIWIGVLGRHRKECFEACEYVIGQIKGRAPIWKHETYEDGSQDWVSCPNSHRGKEERHAPQSS